MTGILMDDPPPEVESLEQLNDWRINHRELGSRQFARVLKDGIFLCKYVPYFISVVCIIGYHFTIILFYYRLVNTLEPGTIKKIHEEKLSRFKMVRTLILCLRIFLVGVTIRQPLLNVKKSQDYIVETVELIWLLD